MLFKDQNAKEIQGKMKGVRIRFLYIRAKIIDF